VDVMGYWSPSNTPATAGVVGNLSFVKPTRVLETRGSDVGGPIGLNPDGTAIATGQLAPGLTRRFLIGGKSFADVTFPGDVKGILANVTIVQPTPSGGFVTAFPGDVADADRPNASTVNPATAVAASFWGNGLPLAPAANPGTEAVFSTN